MKSPSPATAIALAALFVALGGAGYAATQLPKNSVGTAQIKKNAVTSAKVRNGSLLAADFKAGQLPQGARGEAGAKGDTGARGPSDAYLGTRNGSPLVALTTSMTAFATTPTLPAGSYVVSGRVNLVGGGSTSTGVVCGLASDAVQSLTVAASTVMPIAMSGAQTLTSPGTISINCSQASGSTSVAQASVVATRVESLTTN